MKRFFYILFLSTTVFFSFGFKGCAIICYFIYGVTDHTFDLRPGQDGVIVIGPNGEISHCNKNDCGCGVTLVSTQNLNGIGNRGVSSGDASTPEEFITVIVGDSGTVLYSIDGGETLDDRSIPGVMNNLYDFDFLDYGGDDLQVVVCGEDGIMYKSTNSGSGWTWLPVNAITSNNLTSIITITTDYIIAVGDNGTIVRTSNGGQTWENKSVAVNIQFNKIFDGIEINAFGYAWAVADEGKIFATTDYGNSWFPQQSGVIENLNDVAFRNQNEGTIIGDNCAIRRTTNSGITWFEDSKLDSLCQMNGGDIFDLAVIDQNTASVLIRNTTTDEVVTITRATVSSEPLNIDEDEYILPSEFSLAQNYPNPFNPNTVISYQLAQSGNVSLKVFDVLGNELRTLVDEHKPAGSYEVNFNAEELVSGIYFYKLQAGTFNETKKMVLVK